MATVSEELVPLVIDNGSGCIKAGLAGSADVTAPAARVPSVVGVVGAVQAVDAATALAAGAGGGAGASAGASATTSKRRSRLGKGQPDALVGAKALAPRRSSQAPLLVQSPIKRGIVTDWENMERLWDHTFRVALKVGPVEHPVLLTEPPLNPKGNRERSAVLMFEKFGVPALYSASTALMALYAAGCTTGMSVDIGYEVTHCVPVYEGFSLTHAVRRMPVGGRHIALKVQQLLQERKATPVTLRESVAAKVAESVCYVPEDQEEETRRFNQPAIRASQIDTRYALPDGKRISVSSERYQAPEVLFRQDVDKGVVGIPDCIMAAAQRCEWDVRKEMFSNLVVSGGSSALRGMDLRIQQDVEDRAPARAKINVVAPKHRAHAAWLGGAIVASLSSFKALWITHQEYADAGPTIMHRKCA